MQILVIFYFIDRKKQFIWLALPLFFSLSQRFWSCPCFRRSTGRRARLLFYYVQLFDFLFSHIKGLTLPLRAALLTSTKGEGSFSAAQRFWNRRSPLVRQKRRRGTGRNEKSTYVGDRSLLTFFLISFAVRAESKK
jgi:hypothetical protein